MENKTKLNDYLVQVFADKALKNLAHAVSVEALNPDDARQYAKSEYLGFIGNVILMSAPEMETYKKNNAFAETASKLFPIGYQIQGASDGGSFVDVCPDCYRKSGLADDIYKVEAEVESDCRFECEKCGVIWDEDKQIYIAAGSPDEKLIAPLDSEIEKILADLLENLSGSETDSPINFHETDVLKIKNALYKVARKTVNFENSRVKEIIKDVFSADRLPKKS